MVPIYAICVEVCTDIDKDLHEHLVVNIKYYLIQVEIINLKNLNLLVYVNQILHFFYCN